MQSVSDGKDFLNRHVLSWRRKVYSDWEDVASSGRAFQVFGSATAKARSPTVDRLTDGTRRRLVPVERSDRLPGRPRTGATREWSKVRRCTSVKNSECQQRDLKFNRLCNVPALESGQGVSDVMGRSHVVGERIYCSDDRLTSYFFC